MNRPHPVRLLLVDSHALTRSALGCLLTYRPGVAWSARPARWRRPAAWPSRTSPDVILLHLRHGERTRRRTPFRRLLLAAGPAARVSCWSPMRPTPTLHRRAVRSGRRGIVGTDRPPERCSRRSRRSSQGEVWMERRLRRRPDRPGRRRPDRDHARIGSLTPREREVVRPALRGPAQQADRRSPDGDRRHRPASPDVGLQQARRVGPARAAAVRLAARTRSRRHICAGSSGLSDRCGCAPRIGSVSNLSCTIVNWLRLRRKVIPPWLGVDRPFLSCPAGSRSPASPCFSSCQRPLPHRTEPSAVR